MTNAEAIEHLKTIEIYSFQDGYTDEAREALDMAISALQSQEWIPVNKRPHPDTPERVQVQLDNGWIITAYYEENEWLSVPDCGEPIEERWWIEAWKPLPELYQEDTDE